MSAVQFDYMKFRDVVHVIAERCPQDRLGRVKLHKTLYFSDMFSYVATGKPLTGAEYRKQPRGPMASSLARALKELVANGALVLRRENYFGFEKDVFDVAEPAPRNRLTDAEVALLDEVIKFTCLDNNARAISEFSHTRAWESATVGEVMPYRQAFLMFSSSDDDDDEALTRQELESEARTTGWMGPDAVRAFRARLRPGSGAPSLSR
jgi:hypothetical protein